jgi:hypothetical protein
MNLNPFTRAYVECALWSSVDDDGDSLENNYDDANISPETLKQMVEDCESFETDAEDELAESGLDDERADHDFWLTRNGHGAGFWDEGLGKIGQTLTEKAEAYGSFDLYVGDDGMVHGQ